MKKNILLLLFIINALNGMENHDHTQSSIFSRLLEKYDIQTEGRSILHIECSTGEFSAKLAEKACRVHGFDANKNCIDTAKQKYCNLKNISFEHCPSIIFNFSRVCDLALIDYIERGRCTDVNTNKKELFQCINQHLSHNGEMFISIATRDNTLHPNIVAGMNIIPHIQMVIPDSTEESIIELMMPSYSSLQELLTMLQETGFEVMTHEERYITTAMDLKSFSNVYGSLITQNPLFQCIQNQNDRRQLIKLFTQNYIATLTRDDKGNLLEPTITTIIHARKIENNA